MRKTSVAFLLDPDNPWLAEYLEEVVRSVGLRRKYVLKCSFSPSKVSGSEIVFILGYTRILSQAFLESNKYNLVVHESALPRGRGFSPVQWQVLAGRSRIPVCLFEATPEVDAGDIFERDCIRLTGSELFDEIRCKQAAATVRLIRRFLGKYPRIHRAPQEGAPTFFRRFGEKDDRLDIDKTLRQQFDHLRIANNKQYPLFFIYRGKRYYLRISRDLRRE